MHRARSWAGWHGPTALKGVIEYEWVILKSIGTIERVQNVVSHAMQGQETGGEAASEEGWFGRRPGQEEVKRRGCAEEGAGGGRGS